MSLFLVLYGCDIFKSKSSIKYFEALIYNEIIFSSEINFPSGKGPLDGGPGTQVTILVYKNGPHVFSLKYRFYSNSEDSRLTLFKNKKKIASIFSPTQINLDFERKDSYRLHDKRLIKAWNLTLSFMMNSKFYDFRFPLYNIKKVKKKFVRMDIYEEKQLLSGFSISVYKKRTNLIHFKTNDYSTGVSYFCHDFNKKCFEVTENHCHRCRYGSFSIPTNSCHGEVPKLCGINNCGEKGAVACLKSFPPEKNICKNLTKYAYCKRGLELVCDERSIAICE